MLTAEAISPLQPLSLSRRDYSRLGAAGAFDGRRVQLVEGMVVVTSPMGTSHAWTVSRLTKLLQRQLLAAELSDAFDVRVQLPLAVSDISELEPDLAVIPALRRPGADHPKSAALVIEVADSSLKLDLGPKARLFARAEVPDYWVVDLSARVLVAHRSPRHGRYASVRRLAVGQRATVAALPCLKVGMGELEPEGT